jgi:hypothetical protein
MNRAIADVNSMGHNILTVNKLERSVGLPVPDLPVVDSIYG